MPSLPGAATTFDDPFPLERFAGQVLNVPNWVSQSVEKELSAEVKRLVVPEESERMMRVMLGSVRLPKSIRRPADCSEVIAGSFHAVILPKQYNVNQNINDL